MEITVRSVADAIIYFGAIAIALVAIAAVVRFTVLQPLKTWITEQITARIQPPLEEVRDEVTPNGGGSLRDVVNRIETKQNELTARFNDHLNNHPGSSR